MRPRPDAAENGDDDLGPAPVLRAASMRPRPDAAENALGGPGSPRPACFNEAAARCRGKRGRDLQAPPPGDHASMRPRPDAAENQEVVSLEREFEAQLQ